MKSLAQCLAAMLVLGAAITWGWFSLFHRGAHIPSVIDFRLYVGGPVEGVVDRLTKAGLVPHDFGELASGLSWSALAVRVANNVAKLAGGVLLFAAASSVRQLVAPRKRKTIPPRAAPRPAPARQNAASQERATGSPP